MKAAAVIVTLALGSGAAHSDWSEASAGYFCDGEEFAIQAVVMSSSGNVPLPRGFHRIGNGRSTVVCNMSGMRVSAHVMLVPPGERGYCAAVGFARLRDLKINGTMYVPASASEFTNPCASEPGLTRIEVHARERTIQTCRGVWKWGDKFEDVDCQTNPIKRRTAHDG